MLTPPPLSLYVHLPWCVRKCPYCDFNSHERRGPLPFDSYIDALMADLDHDLPLVWGRTVQTVFFGGGTPSLFPPEHIDRFLQEASSRLRFAPGCEITLETNPGTAEHGRFEMYRKAGVNRLSFGIQSFDDGCLQRLGRIHDSGEAEAAVKLAQDAGFDNINLDLMYALPQQTLAMAERDLERAFALQPTHISHYQLTLEPNTLFAAKPPQGIPDDDASWDMQEHCQALLADQGYAQYEVSAYAQPDRQCAHNLNYWRYGDYLGIGAGAHGKLTSHTGVIRETRRKHPHDYLQAAARGEFAVERRAVTAEELPFEFMMNALRLCDGFPTRLYTERTGLALAGIQSRLLAAQRDGLLNVSAATIAPTARGQRYLNALLRGFLPE